MTASLKKPLIVEMFNFYDNKEWLDVNNFYMEEIKEFKEYASEKGYSVRLLYRTVNGLLEEEIYVIVESADKLDEELKDKLKQLIRLICNDELSYAYSEANRTNLKNAETYYKTTDFYLTEKLGK